ncbi:MAG: hypothetical protein EON55_15530, partial [Alphaproteobacteria bacterium]
MVTASHSYHSALKYMTVDRANERRATAYEWGLGKQLWTELDVGEKVKVLGVWDGPEEARRV